MSQNKQILEYLENNPKGITPIEALWKFNCFRLAGRIYDIRSMLPRDKEIVTERETRNGKTYAKYILENKAQKILDKLGEIYNIFNKQIMKKKIGVIFMQYPKDFINSKTKTRETFYTGQTEEGHKIYAYENMSKNGGKYLSVYFDPESEKGDRYPKSGFVGTQGDDTVIDPDDLPF